MNRNKLSILFILTLAILGVVGTATAGWRPGLGLDLQGGASVVYAPKGEFTPDSLRQAETIIRRRVDGLGVAEPVVRREGNRIVVELPGVTDRKRALSLVGRTAELRFRPVLQSLPTKLDLEVQRAEQANVSTSTTAPGGSTTTVPGASTTTVRGGSTTTVPGGSTTTTAAASTSTSVAPSLGGRGANVLGQADSATSVASTAVPSTAIPSTAAPGTTPTTIRPATTRAGATTTPAATATTAAVSPSTTVSNAATTTTAAPAPTPSPTFGPDGLTVLTTPDEDVADAYVTLAETDRDGTETARYFLGPTALTGRIVGEANADNSEGTWKVLLEFTGEGSRQWDNLAASIVGRQLAIVLDGDVISAPTIQVAQFNGRAEITGGLGGFEEREARDLALALRYGSLPIQLTEETVQTVSATLGNDSLRAGIWTGMLGILLVAAYMIFFYRALGLVVIAGLCVSASLMWTLIAFVSESYGLALSLSGAVGLIVSVGVTVDSYVVYFEKLKDEIRSGRPIGSSVERGFRRAWRTILAADFVSLLGAAILYISTTGGVRGFAFFLMLSTGLDIFVAWFFTRPVVALLGTREFFTKGRWGVATNLAITPAAIAMASAATAAVGPRIRPGAGGSAATVSGGTRIVPGAARSFADDAAGTNVHGTSKDSK